MIRAAFICIAISGQAIAGPVQIIGSGPAEVELAQTSYGYSVTYRNFIVSSLTVENWQLEAGKLTVAGQIVAGDDVLPDDMIVVPPPGWFCDPCRVTVEEKGSGTVELWPEVGA